MSTPGTKPQRIQLKRTKGWRLPPNTISVARPTKWGNTYPVSVHGREAALNLYEARLGLALLKGELDLGEIRGKHLACWCHPTLPCHADILLRKANE